MWANEYALGESLLGRYGVVTEGRQVLMSMGIAVTILCSFLSASAIWILDACEGARAVPLVKPVRQLSCAAAVQGSLSESFCAVQVSKLGYCSPLPGAFCAFAICIMLCIFVLSGAHTLCM